MEKPWEREPDYYEFVSHGYICVIVRHKELKHLCGYIGVPKRHRLYGVDADAAPLQAHGGITYSSNTPVRRFSKEIANMDLWWLGFDCGHYGDLVPSMLISFRDVEGVYRDMNYVKGELVKLAKQLQQLESN